MGTGGIRSSRSTRQHAPTMRRPGVSGVTSSRGAPWWNPITKYRRAASGESGPPPEYDASMVEYIPPEWGTQSTQMRVVESGSKNEFEFDIKGPTK